MIPRADIVGIDIEDDLEEIVEQIRTAQHTRMPVTKETSAILSVSFICEILAGFFRTKRSIKPKC
jgi:CBS domain containing-hemolysin-like protein